MQTENSNSQDGDIYGGVGSPGFLAARAIFTSNACINCHSDFSKWTEAEFIAQGLVVAGDADNSKMYYRLTGSSGANGPKNMPTTGGALTAGEVSTIKDWIDNI